MKIGIRPDTYNRWGDSRFLKMKEHGYSCADYVMVNTQTHIYQCSEEEFEEIILHDKLLAKEAGIEITQVHGPFRMPPKDLEPEDQKERMEKMKRSIRAASLLECRYWIVHPLMPYGIEDAGTPEAEKTWQVNLKFMKELLVTAKEYGVTICLENMSFRHFSMSSPDKVCAFIREIEDENFKMCLDTGHANVYGGKSVGDLVREYGDLICALHIHDNNGKMDLHSFPFFGNIDWEDFYAALQEVKFAGDFSLETELSRNLPTPIYEEMCGTLVKIVQYILNGSKFS